MKLRKGTETGRPVHGRWYGDACGAAFAMELIGERWTIPVIRELMLGGRRFSDIRASLPGISAKTLTERLETLQGFAIVERAQLPPPAAGQIYRLTEWGRGLEPVLQELGRWAVRSPCHDQTLPLTPVSLMLSMRTMLDRARIGDMDIVIAFDIGPSHFAARLRQDGLVIEPAGERLASADLRFGADDAAAFPPVLFGKLSPAEAGNRLAIEGDPVLARRFIDLFALPPKNAG